MQRETSGDGQGEEGRGAVCRPFSASLGLPPLSLVLCDPCPSHQLSLLSLLQPQPSFDTSQSTTQLINQSTAMDTQDTMREMKVEIGNGTKMKCQVRYEAGQVVGKATFTLTARGEQRGPCTVVLCGEEWGMPLKEANEVFLQLPGGVIQVRGRVNCNKRVHSEGVVKVECRETLSVLASEHGIWGGGAPMSCLRLVTLDWVLEALGFDVLGRVDGVWRAGVEGSKQRVRVVSVKRVLWSVTNEVGFVMAGLPLKLGEGGITLNQILKKRKLLGVTWACKDRVVLDALNLGSKHVSLIPFRLIGDILETVGVVLVCGGTVEIGGSVLGCVAWPVVGVSSHRDGGISPLVRVMDVSKHGYGVGEQWLNTFLHHHKLAGLTTTVSSHAIKRVYEHATPVQVIPVTGLRHLESRVAHGKTFKVDSFSHQHGAVVGRPLSGGGAEHAWRRVTICVTVGLHGAHAVVAGVVPVCMWRDSSFYVPYTIVRWLGWAGRRKVVGDGR